MLNTLAWQHVSRRIGARWSGELRIEKSHLQRSSLSADLRPQRSASTSERGWLPQPRSHAVARTPYSSPHFGPSRRSDLSQNAYLLSLLPLTRADLRTAPVEVCTLACREWVGVGRGKWNSSCSAGSPLPSFQPSCGSSNAAEVVHVLTPP